MAHGYGREANTYSSAVFVWVFVSVALIYLGCPLTGLGVFPGPNGLQDIGACVNKSGVIIKGSLVTPYTHTQAQLRHVINIQPVATC